MNDECPICAPGSCKGYPHLWKMMRENPSRWFHIHEQVNGRSTSQNLDYPSLFQQATNAVQAVGSVVTSIIRNEPITVPQEEQDRRLAICHACEFWDTAQGRCSKCGCFGAWKTWLASQRCPIEKW
jgi:Family of unknown function (DUF6171)